MNKYFENYLKKLMEKHMPIYFMDDEYLTEVVNAICQNNNMTRREILILAYSIGANSEESNQLLRLKGYDPLYVKKREDAVWKFALENHMDTESIINKIIPQNVDKKNS